MGCAMSLLNQWNFYILDFIQAHFRSPLLDVVMPFITSLGNIGFIWIALGLILLARKRWRLAGILLLSSLLIESLFCNVIFKNMFAVPRPFEFRADIELLIPKPTDYSFPSGHTGASFAAVAALYLSKSKYWILALVMAVLISFSRLYLYVHYPTDVLGGIVIGLFSGWLAYRISIFVIQHYNKRKQE